MIVFVIVVMNQHHGNPGKHICCMHRCWSDISDKFIKQRKIGPVSSGKKNWINYQSKKTEFNYIKDIIKISDKSVIWLWGEGGIG